MKKDISKIKSVFGSPSTEAKQEEDILPTAHWLPAYFFEAEVINCSISVDYGQHRGLAYMPSYNETTIDVQSVYNDEQYDVELRMSISEGTVIYDQIRHDGKIPQSAERWITHIDLTYIG